MKTLLSIAVGLTAALSYGQTCPTPAGGFPAGEWPSRVAETAAARPAAVKALDDYAFTLTGKDADRDGIRTEGLVIIHDGKLIYEKYGKGFTADKRHILWSVTKTIAAAIVGALEHKGAISMEESICAYYEAPSDKCDITVRHLMEMGSGQEWAENYENKTPQTSSVLATLYGEGHKDAAAWTLSQPRAGAPGTVFNYSTGESIVLMAVARGAAKKAGLPESYFRELFMDPIGVTSFRMDRDAAGTHLGGSHGYLTPRDMARFGYLLLNEGCWNGTRLLSQNFMENYDKPNPVWMTGNGKYTKTTSVNGWGIWLNTAVPEFELEKRWPDAPEGTLYADGHWGQSIWVIPSINMVVVRTADDRDGAFSENEVLKLAIAVGGVQ